jgi:hypothetical protein
MRSAKEILNLTKTMKNSEIMQFKYSEIGVSMATDVKEFIASDGDSLNTLLANLNANFALLMDMEDKFKLFKWSIKMGRLEVIFPLLFPNLSKADAERVTVETLKCIVEEPSICSALFAAVFEKAFSHSPAFIEYALKHQYIVSDSLLTKLVSDLINNHFNVLRSFSGFSDIVKLDSFVRLLERLCISSKEFTIGIIDQMCNQASRLWSGILNLSHLCLIFIDAKSSLPTIIPQYRIESSYIR